MGCPRLPPAAGGHKNAFDWSPLQQRRSFNLNRYDCEIFFYWYSYCCRCLRFTCILQLPFPGEILLQKRCAGKEQTRPGPGSPGLRAPGPHELSLGLEARRVGAMGHRLLEGGRQGCFCNGGEDEFTLHKLSMKPNWQMRFAPSWLRFYELTQSRIQSTARAHHHEYERTTSKSIHVGQLVPQPGAFACSGPLDLRPLQRVDIQQFLQVAVNSAPRSKGCFPQTGARAVEFRTKIFQHCLRPPANTR